ncbi:aminotransferase class III-fold pyridoxal phosphate-dependent enzyme [Thalassospiraceae bacterium LMO-JJ14]|nr:aminotransferase class III-fold pyridoxal phosphate-dependent enzyme [Thalassospiraceae bacterium LMO-JJ14]
MSTKKHDKTTPATGKGQALYAAARNIMPGGTQLLSKRPEMFLPDQWPAYFEKARGAEVWDLDGRKYFDFTHCGVGTSALGYADPDVNAAVAEAISKGTMTTLNCHEEVELAELLIDRHPWADMARFARTGGEVLSIAVRIARAATGRDGVAYCGYHGWADWYVAANISDDSNLDNHLLAGIPSAGVPSRLGGTVFPFAYNDIEDLRAIVAARKSELAAIVMEPMRTLPPAPGFLEEARRLADEAGAVLIFDEVTSGWRMTTGGIHMTMGVTPDVATFAKCMSNGYPMAACIGKRAVMDSAQSSFISSAYWTERVGPVAALATIKKHLELDLPRQLIAKGEKVQAGWRQAADAVGLKINVTGIPPLATLSFDHATPLVPMTLFTQQMLGRGYLAGGQVYSMLAHTDDMIDGYLANVAEVFGEIAAGVQADDLEQRLNGPVKHAHFARLN